MRSILLPAALLPLLAPVAPAQLPALYEVAGDLPGDWFGSAVGPAGDVNGDGVPDFLVGAHQNLNGGHSLQPGYARVFDGATGLELYTLEGDGTNWIDGPDDHFGCSVDTVGDIDGDGRDDFVVGAYKDDNVDHNVGMLRMFSGVDGTLLCQLDGDVNGDRMGISVAGMPDMDGDGIRDFITGVYKDDNTFYNAGATRLYSGADCAELLVLDGPGVGAAFGWSCRPAGDVDGDGVIDIVSGGPLHDVGVEDVGYAAVHSGATGELLHEWVGDAHRDYFGHVVDGVGDVDADGRADVIVGAIQATFTGEASGPGYVRVFSGLDGSVIHELTGDELFDQYGYSARGVGDVNGDGHDDFLVGAPRAVTLGYYPTGLPGYARLHSGRDAAVIHTFQGESADDQFGLALARIEDVDGDGLPEFLFGASEDVLGQTRTGYAKLVSGGLVLTSRYCTAAPNSAGPGALLDHSGTLSITLDDFTLHASGCPPQHFGLFYYGTSAVELPFGDGFRCIGGSLYRLGLANTGTGGSASLAVDLVAPPQPSGQVLPGSTWHFQFWYRDVPAMQSGFNLSDALAATFAP